MSQIEAYRKVCKLAGMAVVETPRDGAYTGKVRRELLNEIEDALIAAGFDMKAARAHHDGIKRAENKAIRSRLDAERVAKFPIGTSVQAAHWLKGVNRYDTGKIVEPGAGKNGRVFVAWNNGVRGWFSAFNLDPLRR